MLVLDPYVLAALPGETGAAHIRRVTKRLRHLIQICRNRGFRLVADAVGWNYLERHVIPTLIDHSGSPELATSLSILRRNYLEQRQPFPLTGGRTWGIKPLFGGFVDARNAAFGDFVAKSIGHTMHSGANEVYLFVEGMLGRNLTERGASPSIITEKTRWRVYVAYSGHLVAAVPCIARDRNIAVPWTCRCDDLLPDTGTYAFAPPDNWERRATQVVATQVSKAVWLDRLGNGWARPSTPPPGLPEHWDVYIQPSWRAQLKLAQVNITRYGVSDPPRIPGEVHHVPAGKVHVLQT
jgi:hypothetical protein